MQKARTEEIRIPFGVGIAGLVAQSKQPINIRDAYEVGTRFATFFATRLGELLSVLWCGAVPLYGSVKVQPTI